MGIDRDSVPISITAEIRKPNLGERIRKIFNNDKKKQPPQKTLEELANLTPESVSKPTESTSEVSTSEVSTPEISTTTIQIEDTEQQQINEIRQKLGLLETKPEIKVLPPNLIILSIDDFKECIGSNDGELVYKNNRQQILNQKCEWNISTSINSAKRNHRYPPDNVTDIQDKQWLVKKTINNMSFKEKQIKDNERTETIEKLTKYGVKNSESLIIALENAASPLIYSKKLDSQEKPIDILYDCLFIENNLTFFQKINDLNNGEPIDSDYFKKLAIINGINSDITKIHSNIDQFLIEDKFNQDQFDQVVSLVSKYPDAFYYSSDILNKITSNNFSNEELENQLANEIKLGILFDDLDDLDSISDHSEITLQNLESFYLNSSSSVNKLAVAGFLNSYEYKNFSLSEKQTIWQVLSLGIGVNSRSKSNYGDYDYNSELSQYSQILIKNFNSQDKDYLQTIVNSFKDLDIKAISILSQFPDIIKTEKGIDLIKSFKENNDYRELINSFIEIIIDNDQKITNDILQTAVLNNVDQDLFEKLLKPENFTSFSPEDQRFWNYYLNIDCFDKDGVRDFITKNKQDFFNFFDTKNQPIPYFLESFAKSKFNYGGLVENGFLKTTLTPELIKNFSNSNDQKLWSVISSVGDSYRLHILNFIIDKKTKCFEFFNTNNQPTSLFFEEYAKNGHFEFTKGSFLKTSLTPELLKTFSQEDQKLWDFLFKNNHLDEKVNRFIFENKDKSNEFFDANNQPTSLFLEKYILEDKEPSYRQKSFIFNSLSILYKNESRPELLKILNNFNQKNIDHSGFFIGRLIQSNYKDKEKRTLTPIGLCAWRVYQDYLNSNKNTILNSDDLNNILTKIDNEVEKKRNYINNTKLEVPSGLKVSFGTEIEVIFNGLARTKELTNEEIINYQQLIEKSNQRPSSFLEDYLKETSNKIYTAKSKYKEQVNYVTDLGVGEGFDAVHEFANEPVTDYSVLLWELYEISKLGFLNFDRKFLQYIERGIHLTISGDTQGIKLDGNANLFQNALSASGFSTDGLDAVGSSEIIDTVDDDSKKLYKQIKGFILERDYMKTTMFDNSTNAKGVENRSFRIDSFNHLARTLQLTNRLAIPLKAYQQYVDSFPSQENNLLSKVDELIKNNQKLSQILGISKDILPEIKSEKEQKSTIIWAYFRNKTVKAFHEKQKNISRYKLKSPLETYNPRDVTRLGAELFEIFGGISDEGIKLDDALKNYHSKVETDSLPEVQRKIILEVNTEIGKLFKKPAVA